MFFVTKVTTQHLPTLLQGCLGGMFATTVLFVSQTAFAGGNKNLKPAAKSEAPKEAIQDTVKEVAVGTWVAAGSGCKGNNANPGDMKLETELIKNGANTLGMKGKLKLPSYKLKSPLTPPAKTLTFARECAVRMQILVPKGMRVKTVSAETKVEFSKDKAVSSKIQSLLYFNGEVAAAGLNESQKGEQVGFREIEMKLVPGVFPQGSKVEKQPVVGECGTPFMYGFDYTFLAERTAASDMAEMKLVGDSQGLVFGLELEKCL